MHAAKDGVVMYMSDGQGSHVELSVTCCLL